MHFEQVVAWQNLHSIRFRMMAVYVLVHTLQTSGSSFSGTALTVSAALASLAALTTVVVIVSLTVVTAVAAFTNLVLSILVVY